MFVSSLSDIIQVTYFKATHGKRVFRMAPLHHHFELGGMPETRVVAMYYIVHSAAVPAGAAGLYGLGACLAKGDEPVRGCPLSWVHPHKKEE